MPYHFYFRYFSFRPHNLTLYNEDGQADNNEGGQADNNEDGQADNLTLHNEDGQADNYAVWKKCTDYENCEHMQFYKWNTLHFNFSPCVTGSGLDLTNLEMSPNNNVEVHFDSTDKKYYFLGYGVENDARTIPEAPEALSAGNFYRGDDGSGSGSGSSELWLASMPNYNLANNPPELGAGPKEPTTEGTLFSGSIRLLNHELYGLVPYESARNHEKQDVQGYSYWYEYQYCIRYKFGEDVFDPDCPDSHIYCNFIESSNPNDAPDDYIDDSVVNVTGLGSMRAVTEDELEGWIWYYDDYKLRDKYWSKWYRMSSWSGLTPGGTYQGLNDECYGTFEAVPNWEPKPYKVHYIANNPASLGAETIIENTVDKDLPIWNPPDAQCYGQYIYEWNTKPDGSGKSYTFNDSYGDPYVIPKFDPILLDGGLSEEAAVTIPDLPANNSLGNVSCDEDGTYHIYLYAQWRRIPYTYVFRKGDGESGDDVPVISYYDEDIPLFNNTPQLHATPNVNYEPGQRSDIESPFQAGGRYSNDKYWHIATGGGSSGGTSGHSPGTTPSVLPHFKKEGYFIKQWNVSVEGLHMKTFTLPNEQTTKTRYQQSTIKSEYVTIPAFTCPGNLTFTHLRMRAEHFYNQCYVFFDAVWEPIQYQVQYHNDTSQFMPDFFTYKFDRDKWDDPTYYVYDKDYEVKTPKFKRFNKSKYDGDMWLESTHLGWSFQEDDRSKNPTFVDKSLPNNAKNQAREHKFNAFSWHYKKICGQSCSYAELVPMMLRGGTPTVGTASQYYQLKTAEAEFDWHKYFDYVSEYNNSGASVQHWILYAVYDDQPGMATDDFIMPWGYVPGKTTIDNCTTHNHDNARDYFLRSSGKKTKSKTYLEEKLLDAMVNNIHDREDPDIFTDYEKHFYLAAFTKNNIANYNQGDNTSVLGDTPVTFELDFTVEDKGGHRIHTRRALFCTTMQDILVNNYSTGLQTYNKRITPQSKTEPN